MRYNVNYNQSGLLTYNERNPNKQIDLIDAILLNWISTTIQEWKNIERKKIGEQTFYWIAYDKILNELPSLSITTKDGLANRLKNKLVNYGLLKKFVDKDNNSKTFFRITPLGQQTVLTQTTNGTPPGRTTEPHPDDRPNNNITKDYLTKDAREDDALFFLKENYNNRYLGFKDQYRENINDYSKFCKHFNDTVLIEDLNFNPDILFERLTKYARNWVKRQRKENTHQSHSKVYRRKIS